MASRKATAKRIKDLNTYSGDVGLYELSKLMKKGSVSAKYIIVARYKPRSGLKNTIVWFASPTGNVTVNEPVAEFRSQSMTDVFTQLGYTLV